MGTIPGYGNERWLRIAAGCCLLWVALTSAAAGGPYRDSAHGDPDYGVNRSALDVRYGEYATGNCAHCHEMHASVDGADPAPAGGPAGHALFSRNFNQTRDRNPYLESDNFCFFCHSEQAGPQVANQDYSGSFGGAAAGTGPESILAAFNQLSYHNLYDVWRFVDAQNAAFPWYKASSNPCSACHNPHLAKRNTDRVKPGYPLLSAISKPGSHDALWGETQLMSSYLLSYEAPYASGTTREPGGVGEADGSKTPDYVGFCTTCHNVDNVLWSTTLNAEVRKVNWGETTTVLRDKHGPVPRDGTVQLRDPYAAAELSKSNFVLSCLDCHEPHGSSSAMLLRRRINGEDLTEPISTIQEMGEACRRCHKDDLAAQPTTGQANKWEYAHHGVAGAPYAKSNCIGCHGVEAEPVPPVPCANCHKHGMDDSWAGANKTGRVTF